MNVLTSHRKQQSAELKALQRKRKAESELSSIDISAEIARAKRYVAASSNEFAVRAASARKALPSATSSVMVGPVVPRVTE